MTEEYRLPPASPFSRTIVTEEMLEAERTAKSARIGRAIAERQAEEAEHARQLERDRRERGAAELEAYRVACETRWLDNGGEPSGFRAAWPAMRDRWLTERATGPTEVERHEQILRESGQFNRL